MAQGTARIGVEPVRIVRMENHDRAYTAWVEAGVSGRTVLHIDAHHDLEPFVAEDELRRGIEGARDLGAVLRSVRSGRVTIGNFLTAAFERGLLSRLVWAMAEPAWRLLDRRGLARSLDRAHGQAFRVLEEGADRLVLDWRGRRVEACPLEALPRFDEPVLLDIDADVLLPRLETLADPEHVLPHLWPEDLVGLLAERGLATDLATISSSVQGNYVPARLRWLADDVERLLALAPAGAQGRRLRRAAAVAWAAGDLPGAGILLEQALAIGPSDASYAFQLALVRLAEGRPDEARELYRRALELEAAYGQRYNHLGPLHLSRRRFGAALASYRAMEVLDPGNVELEYGLGWIALETGSFAEAARRLGRFAEARPDSAPAHAEHALALRRAGRLEDALAAIDRSLSRDPTSAASHRERALLLWRTGRRAEAEAAFDRALLYGARRLADRARGAWMALLRGRPARALALLLRGLPPG